MTDSELAEVAVIEERCNKATEGPWRTYVNPQRSDGLFVAQDKPIEPYPKARGMGGEPLYPATPHDAWGIQSQLEHDNAEFVAHARQDIPRLIEIIKAQHEQLRSVGCY